MKSSPSTETVIANGKKWKRVERPRPWKPQAGDVVVGTFLDRRMREGQTGSYEVMLFRTADGTFSVSGVVIMDLLDGAGPLEPEKTLLRIKFLGNRPIEGTDLYFKDFELFVEK